MLRSRTNKSGYYGVYPQTSGCGWYAKIKNPYPPYQQIYLGAFPTPEDAAKIVAQRVKDLGLTPYRYGRKWAVCKYGHPFTETNTLYERHNRNGRILISRRCRKCRQEYDRLLRQHQKDERDASRAEEASHDLMAESA